MTDTVDPMELSEIASRLQFRKVVGFVAGGVLLVWLVVFILLAVSLISSSTHTGALAARSDCKTQYNSILIGPVQTRDNLTSQVDSLSADLNSQLGSALLALQLGNNPSPAVVADYAATKAALDVKRSQLSRAIEAVNREPTLNAATTEGFTFAGHSYPACPAV